MRITFRIPRHPRALAEILDGLGPLAKKAEVTRSPESSALILRVVVPDNPADLGRALEAGVRLNVLLMKAWIARGHQVPTVYQSTRYVPEPIGREWWQTFADNMTTGEGDCEDLAMHQAGWYRAVAGMPAKAVVKKTGKRVYHAVVEHVGGIIEDPSLPLGLARLRVERRRKALQR